MHSYDGSSARPTRARARGIGRGISLHAGFSTRNLASAPYIQTPACASAMFKLRHVHQTLGWPGFLLLSAETDGDQCRIDIRRGIGGGLTVRLKKVSMVPLNGGWCESVLVLVPPKRSKR